MNAEEQAACNGLRLAAWVRRIYGKPLTHVKLQKLCFYTYGAMLSVDGDKVPRVEFHAWKHGPACPEIFEAYKRFGAEEIQPTDEVGIDETESHGG